MMASMGVTDPADLTPHHLRLNVSATDNQSYAELYDWLAPGPAARRAPRDWADDWAMAAPTLRRGRRSAHSTAPTGRAPTVRRQEDRHDHRRRAHRHRRSPTRA